MRSDFTSAEEKDAISSQKMSVRENDGVRMGISKLIMMENAGSAVARLIKTLCETMTTVLFVSGIGNNGGDAFVAARHLAYWKSFNIFIVLIGKESDIHAVEAQTNWNILKQIPNVKKIEIDSVEKLTLMKNMITESNVIVSAIFGTGFRGTPRELQSSVINIINSSVATKISIDIPSGMEADTGNFDLAVKSDYTITMDSPKVGMFASGRTREMCGEILTANIGVPK